MEFAATVIGSAAGATAVLALFIQVTHIIQSKIAVVTVIKSLFGKHVVR